METLSATVRSAAEGEKRWFCGGGLHTWKATSAETGGAFLLFEDHLDQGKVTPLHSHPEADETFYVLEGEVVIHIDGASHTVATGGIAVVPRGIPHAFMVTSAEARMLCLQTPGSGEDFYRQASEPAPDGSSPTPVDIDRVRAAAMATGAIVLLGPPPF